MSFVARTPVRFAHVDPAGIVFYPRYFEMLNGAVEDWFDSMGFDFRHLHQTLGLGAPTVRLEVDFKAPSRLGDQLDFTLAVARASARSCTLRVRVTCGDEVRFTALVVLVCMDLAQAVSVPWPQALSAAMARHEGAADQPVADQAVVAGLV